MARTLAFILATLWDRVEGLLAGYKTGTKAADYTSVMLTLGETGLYLWQWLRSK